MNKVDQPPQSTSAIKILFVDDAVTNRMIGKKIFEQINCQVDLAVNGQDAIDKIKSSHKHYNLIIMDLEMPEMNGYETSIKIRKEKLLFVPIYALTAHDNYETRKRCQEAKFNGYIIKPLNKDKAESLIHKIFI